MRCPNCSLDLPERTDSLKFCLLCNVWYLHDLERGRLSRLTPLEQSRCRRALPEQERGVEQYPIHTLLPIQATRSLNQNPL